MKLFKTISKVLKSEYAVLLLLVIIMIALSAATPLFMTSGNILNIISRTATTGIIGIGITFVIATGGIDLSVGGQMAFASVLGTLFMMEGMKPVLAVFTMILLGALTGLVNGVLISYIKLPAFMVTLAMLNVTEGLAFYLTTGKTLYEIPEAFSRISLTTIGDIPLSAIYLVIVAIIGQIVLRKFTLGRRILALGGNSRGAWFAGINVKRNKMIAYMLCGITAGISAVIMVSRLMSTSANIGDGVELDAIASAVIGGAALSGGSGNMIGTLAGALILTAINNWMNLMTIDPFLRDVVKGVIILLALAFDAWRKGELSRLKLREID